MIQTIAYMIAITVGLITISKFFLSLLVRAKINSSLILRNKPLAMFKITSISSKEIQVQNGRLNIPIWNTSAALKGGSLYNTVCIAADFFNPEQITSYISDYAIDYSSDELPKKLENYQAATIYLDLDKMVSKFIKSNETIINKFGFLWVTLILKIEFTVNNKVFTKHANYRIKYYLYNKYKNKDKLFG